MYVVNHGQYPTDVIQVESSNPISFSLDHLQVRGCKHKSHYKINIIYDHDFFMGISILNPLTLFILQNGFENLHLRAKILF